jgi:hypothetical protein
LLQFLTLSCGFVCFWQMTLFMVLLTFLVSALVGVWIHFCGGSSHEAEFAIPINETRVARIISGCRVIFSFSPNSTQIWAKASAGCVILTHFGAFFFTQSLHTFQLYIGRCHLHSCL